jgi:hypothetical protein
MLFGWKSAIKDLPPDAGATSLQGEINLTLLIIVILECNDFIANSLLNSKMVVDPPTIYVIFVPQPKGTRLVFSQSKRVFALRLFQIHCDQVIDVSTAVIQTSHFRKAVYSAINLSP